MSDIRAPDVKEQAKQDNLKGIKYKDLAETHSFFSKYLSEDTLNIIQEIKQNDPLDILWGNICRMIY